MTRMAKGQALTGARAWYKELTRQSYSLPRGPVGFQLGCLLRQLAQYGPLIAAHPDSADILADIAAYWKVFHR